MKTKKVLLQSRRFPFILHAGFLLGKITMKDEHKNMSSSICHLGGLDLFLDSAFPWTAEAESSGNDSFRSVVCDFASFC